MLACSPGKIIRAKKRLAYGRVLQIRRRAAPRRTLEAAVTSSAPFSDARPAQRASLKLRTTRPHVHKLFRKVYVSRHAAQAYTYVHIH